MPIKTLLVFADSSDATVRRIATAKAMAARHDAHLAALALVEQPAYYYGVGTEVSADLYFEEIERAKAEAVALADKTRGEMNGEGGSGDVRWASGTPVAISEIAARHGRYADLNLLAQPVKGDMEALQSRAFEGVLFDSGRPAVVIPTGWERGAFGNSIVIAWAPCREATRAVSDAMPLIEAASSVRIAIIDPETGEDTYGEEPGADLATVLARHGITVTVDRLPSTGQGIAACLNGHAVDCGADLIVMGGYGHWRLRQTLFGGVTRDMLGVMQMPVLMAH
jgi:nucleotide-binding universal stress UspA family protein